VEVILNYRVRGDLENLLVIDVFILTLQNIYRVIKRNYICMNIKMQNLLIAFIVAGIFISIFTTIYSLTYSHDTTGSCSSSICVNRNALQVSPTIRLIMLIGGFCLLTVLFYLTLVVYRKKPYEKI
jgi:hypothetical protein